MNALVRSITTGVLALAVAGAGFPNVLVAHAANTPPVITSVTLTPVVASEGDTVRLDVAFTDPDPDMVAVTVQWGDGSNSAFTLTPSQRSFFVTRTYPDDFPSRTPSDTFLVTVDLEDLVNPAVRGSATLTLNNVAPEITAFTAPATILRDQSATVTGTWVDPSRGDSYTVELDWGDGSARTVRTYGAQSRDFSQPHVYLAGGTFTLTATVTDDDTGAGSATATIVVTSPNTPPSGLVVSAVPAVEGESTALSASFIDPDTSDTHTASVDWGDETAPQSLSLSAGATTFSPSHVYLNAGTYTATVTVADSAASTPPVTVVVQVGARNRAPSELVLSATSPVEESPATLTGSFTDSDASDTHTVFVNWGDGATSTVPLAAGITSFNATHTYAEPGTYHVTATVTDPAGLSTAAAVDLVVKKKDSGNTKCDQLRELERRLFQSPWADDPRARALLERIIAFLSAHYGCDEDGDENGRGGDDNNKTAPKVTARGDRSHRSDR